MFKPEIDHAKIAKETADACAQDFASIVGRCAQPVSVSIPGADSALFVRLVQSYESALYQVAEALETKREIEREIEPLNVRRSDLNTQLADINTHISELTAARQAALAAGERPEPSSGIAQLREDAAYVQQLIEQTDQEIGAFLVSELHAQLQKKTREAGAVRASLIFAVARERARQIEGELLRTYQQVQKSSAITVTPCGAEMLYVVNGQNIGTAIEHWNKSDLALKQQQREAAAQQAALVPEPEQKPAKKPAKKPVKPVF
ncbi:hypothetical protein EDF88_5012 [Buttiauxella sp. BIGb0552]|uniref:hypothetical protein n=1 Tax=Buttiauxella sp. BIGb0552 TaxID=2485120 RepID=UPI00106622EF|nr:hypothetical protein [Buttiauxella sp. BIGb0552]TDX09597.1 hypothetical protein EDF88_5012 [Buttiauxella sp. BIGb0552]